MTIAILVSVYCFIFCVTTHCQAFTSTYFRRNENTIAVVKNCSSPSSVPMKKVNSEGECALACNERKKCTKANHIPQKRTCQLIDYNQNVSFKHSKGIVHLNILTKTEQMIFKGRCYEMKTSYGTIQDCTALQLLMQSCMEYLKLGFKKNGVYNLKTSLTPSGYVPVFCDMDTNGGGWIVFQKRFDGSLSFEKSWNQYRDGFGDLSGEFWLGLKFVNFFTNKGQKLRIDLKRRNGSWLFRENLFKVENEQKYFKLVIEGGGIGTLADSLNVPRHNRPFSTYDLENSNGCVSKFKGGWWYGLFSQCHYVNLNGIYDSKVSGVGLNWWSDGFDYTYSFKSTEMKMRPL